MRAFGKFKLIEPMEYDEPTGPLCGIALCFVLDETSPPFA